MDLRGKDQEIQGKKTKDWSRFDEPCNLFLYLNEESWMKTYKSSLQKLFRRTSVVLF